MDASDRKKRVAGEASDWFSRLQAGEMERAEREQFVEWLRESHRHIAEMLRLAQINGSLERFQRWARVATGPKTDADKVVQFPPAPQGESTILKVPHPAPRVPPSSIRRSGQRLGLAAFAATVMFIVGTIVMLPRIRGDVIETQRGERREIALADGSMLQIDPQTRLRVKYADTARRVFLDRGRAVFHVARNPNRPFLVQADTTTVRAVGTAFGVEQRVHGVVVTVSEGKVSVQRAAPASQSQRKAQAPELFLTANKQVTVAAGGVAEPVRDVDSTRALAWAEGRLIFQNDELGQAVAEFNRYNRVQLTVTDPVMAKKTVSGVFNAAEPEAFIAFLQSVMPVEIVRSDDRNIPIGSARRP